MTADSSIQYRRMGLIKSQITGNSTVCSNVVPANNKESIKALYYMLILEDKYSLISYDCKNIVI